ncbi:MAG TPA: bifunctional diguanylate cyclase/phosphodiesterase [Alphaproteobacteria bacterium]|nr:bifunctional diguanylate cyclase/phosphodiesterase [Alphaproteobacteria bacterium]
MNTTADLPLLLVASPETGERLTGLLRVGGGASAGAEVQKLTSLAEAPVVAKPHHPHAVPLIAAIAESSHGLGSLLGEVARTANLATVVLTDDRGVAAAAREQGINIVGPISGLTSPLLEDLLQLAGTLQHMRRQQQHLQNLYDLSETRFRDMADQFADWLWEVDTKLNLTFSSSRKRPVASAAKGSPMVACFLPEERLRIEDDFADLTRNPRPFHDRDYWSADPFGTRLCWSVSGTPIFDASGALVGFRGIARDVSGQKAASDQLYYLTNHDPLTGLSNRHRFHDEMTRTLRMAQREKRTGALLLLNLDRFSLINQTHGQAVGDKALNHFAQILKDHVRTGDLLARLDADEFALLMRDVKLADLTPRFEQLQRTLSERPVMMGSSGITLKTSGGIALYPEHGETPEGLMAHAQDALSAAKQHGPNRLEFYNPTTPSTAGAGQRLEWAEFVTACLNNPTERMVLHFQPIVPLGTAEGPEFYEVLVRLIDRTGRAIPPAQYIQVIEEFGLAPKLDRLVSERAIAALAEFHKQGRNLRFSVNLSARTLEDNDFLEYITGLLKGAQLPEKSLVFEMTETSLLKDLQYARAFIAGVARYGVSFALDDCGVGYSSLQHIREMKLDYIKIDGTFIRNVHTNAEDQAMVKALTAVAKQRGIRTVAEMIEHENALQILRDLHVDYGQGFHIAPPAPQPIPPVAA